MAAPLLEVQGLAKQFAVGGAWLARRRRVIRAVDGVSFNVRSGEILGVVGGALLGSALLMVVLGYGMSLASAAHGRSQQAVCEGGVKHLADLLQHR